MNSGSVRLWLSRVWGMLPQKILKYKVFWGHLIWFSAITELKCDLMHLNKCICPINTFCYDNTSYKLLDKSDLRDSAPSTWKVVVSSSKPDWWYWKWQSKPWLFVDVTTWKQWCNTTFGRTCCTVFHSQCQWWWEYFWSFCLCKTTASTTINFRLGVIVDEKFFTKVCTSVFYVRTMFSLTKSSDCHNRSHTLMNLTRWSQLLPSCLVMLLCMKSLMVLATWLLGSWGSCSRNSCWTAFGD